MVIWFKSNKFLVALILLIIPTFYTLLRPGFFWMQDDLQAFRIHQLDKCIQDLQIPCRWVPDAGYQYGYPQFIYYPPSVYYLGEIFNLVGFQFIDAVKILFILGFIFSAITMFIFLRSLLGSWPALVGAILYTYAPYKAVDVYVRGALSEFWAFVFFPVIFWSIYQLIKKGFVKYLAWMGLSIGLLLFTHNLMSMIFLPIAGVWALLWLILEKRWQVLTKLILGGVLGIGLAATFTLPVLLEKPYVHIDSMLSGYFDYRQHFVNLEQLFLSNHFGYGSSYLGSGDDLSMTTGVIHWAAGLLAVALGVLNFRKQKKLSLVILTLAVVDLLVLFLIHQKSTFIWEHLSMLTWLQFPWRILADSIFLLSLLGALAVYLIPQVKLAKVLGVALIAAVMVFYGGFFKPYQWYDISDADKFSGKSWEKQLTISIFDYLPIYATLPPTSKAPLQPEVLEGQVSFSSYQKGSNFQKGVLTAGELSLIRLPLYDFPGMEVKVDNQKITHWNNDCRGQEFCLGLITFKIPAGQHILEARLNNTPVRMIGNLITLTSIIVLGVLIFLSRKHAKNHR
ncbi:MAG: hypothetical protein UU73_C0001G0206 [Candidatus Daviesbacteria bacterium GW2011_GWA1_41_61]|uniref:Membrane protein 6-pyruvoyl-tetrahydropterin synthase-related domain-containing protein n=1 Tax=Candidatus Daviesbacteria bacterium GW2011_GWA2_40_9 TaxID=1618424 RepID=A0A0G0U090_9BACT|nr:MAG: hypothetical protein UU26_C0017G0002 [Candidatus Daviesbacteria bacterium GW2011_GWC1_40_9]KKR82574.1 MAG: hypothetical protein UU29_C0011G0021 [Candidatus Daviesbacteria bacterium GW2011_GWA2_40_9]KKR93025.1 MAG: hypothetical protein UU44_C0004G0207 [Candidatus Daviesbacteria bacterium GW2011_GWB1_41_15]KKS15569.1 MAG: hypothetical protein UU73_C0001G0206 [Candidatus Daviesbacteria bacterium GW2011_GWA1_41_61]